MKDQRRWQNQKSSSSEIDISGHRTVCDRNEKTRNVERMDPKNCQVTVVAETEAESECQPEVERNFWKGGSGTKISTFETQPELPYKTLMI